MITGETLIKGLFYFLLKARGGKYLSRKEIVNKKTGKKSYQYTYANKKGEKSKASHEKPVKESKPKQVKESKQNADKKSMKDKKQFKNFGEFLTSDPIPNAGVQTSKEMPSDYNNKEKFTYTIDLDDSKIFSSGGYLQTGNVIGSASPLIKQNPNQGIFYLKSKDGKDIGAIKHDKDSNRYYYFMPGKNTMFKDEGEVIDKSYLK